MDSAYKKNIIKGIYHKYANEMFRLCYRYVNNEDEATIILNNGFLKVFDNYSKMIDNQNEKAWICKIMINEALKFIRDNHFKKNKSSIEIDKLNIQYHIQTDGNLINEDFYNLIRSLPIGYRTIFNLYAIEGYSHKEIAKKLRIKESTSRSQLTKARAALKEWITKNDLL